MTPIPPSVLSAFQIPAAALRVVPFGQGHIHRTYRLDTGGAGPHARLLLQRVNHSVFPDPVQLGRTIRRTTDHLRAKLKMAGTQDVERRVLTPLPTRAGHDCQQDEEGRWWRAYLFVERAHSLEGAPSPQQAHAAARAFGLFQRSLADLPAPRLPETLPGFHDTLRRFAALQAALNADTAGRAAGVQPEIAFALEREGIAGRLIEAQAAGLLPERVAHNDTKLDNLLFDDATGAPLCVVDLDTVMPGIGLHDFGDLVRTAACSASEDERRLERVHVDPELFGALAAGYLEAMGDLLTAAEKELLVFAGRLICYETGLRFLTDHLQGDTYFQIDRPEQNLDRCRSQFARVRSLESQADALEALVR